VRRVLKGGQGSPSTVSLIIVYTLASALKISPLEIYQMPASLVLDLLTTHSVFEEIKAEEMEKLKKK
tara:strand:+ start:3840 stop:4040 length:201 start_codon:yes stop_codon:yes gene_type:complete